MRMRTSARAKRTRLSLLRAVWLSSWSSSCNAASSACIFRPNSFASPVLFSSSSNICNGEMAAAAIPPMPCGAQCMRDQTTPKWSHLRLQLRDHALVFGRHVLVAVLVVLRSQPPRHRAHLPTQNLRPLFARVVDVKQGESRRVQLELHSRSADACLPLPEHAPGSGRKSLRWADAEHAARSVRARPAPKRLWS